MLSCNSSYLELLPKKYSCLLPGIPRYLWEVDFRTTPPARKALNPGKAEFEGTFLLTSKPQVTVDSLFR